jgi:lipid II:glycine glycyltransferase (peptidoglycan interpeptide bridge formation enzyme)
MVVDLRPGEEELLRQMRKKHRQHINTSAGCGLRVELGASEEHVVHVHRMVEAAGDRHSFTPRSLQWLATVRERFLMNDGGVIGLAWHGEEVAAAILCAVFGDRCYALFAGFRPECAHLHPMEPLYWSTMKWAKQRGCVEYDMQNAPVTYPPTQNQPGYGLYHFKVGFGAEFRYFAGAFDFVGSQIRYRIIRVLETRSGHFVYRAVDGARRLRYRMRRLAAGLPVILRRAANGPHGTAHLPCVPK